MRFTSVRVRDIRSPVFFDLHADKQRDCKSDCESHCNSR
ncbi:hypothetical protein BSU04_46480 [Caballeronia sordidicola]|uniref:Uncharacterized protein n=1 Tax=Caballeronia sordidicola TaxID=196367 RepID=A0A226WJR9_CABSO|nr:hypothetical protein BSU04_46480 [Caballeronia sordidicola]